MDFREISDKLKNSCCLIVGDIILDKYIYGEVSRISPEAPVPVVRVENEKITLGGAANVAGNIRGLGARAVLAGVIGADHEGSCLIDLLSQKDIGFGGLQSEERITTIKTRIVGKDQQIVRVDREISSPISEREEERLLEAIQGQISKFSIVVISDYNKGVCTKRVVEAVIRMARQAGISVLVDPKDNDWSKYSKATIITPNFKELCDVAGYSCKNTDGDVTDVARGLIEKYSLENILVTRSELGMTLVTPDSGQTFRANARSVYDVSGAGDTVVATLAGLLSIKTPLLEAVEIANFAAGISVSHQGTYIVALDEIASAYEVTHDMTDGKIMDINGLKSRLETWRAENKSIIFTNGCFDIIHAGHISYLSKTAAMGDILIIGLNSDDSVRRLKGEGRPVNNQQDRAKVLAALAITDAVVIFEEDTPYELIREIRPDILVKGGDYTEENIVGREFAGLTTTVPLLENHSTSMTIERIQELKS